MGLVSSLRDALTGKTTPEIGTDQYGNQYVKQVTPSGASKWAKIAAQAAVGAARGFAAGKGGNPGAAAAAGVDTGMKFAQQRQQQQQDLSQEARQQNLDRANNQLLTQKIAEQAMVAKRMGVQATQDAIDFSEKQQDWYAQHAEGGQPIEYLNQDGTPTTAVGNVKDAAQMMLQTPGFHANHIQSGLMQPVQLYDKDGKANGFAVYQMKAGATDEMAPAGTPVYHYDAVNDKMVQSATSQPMKMGDVFATNNAAAAQMHDAQLKAQELKDKTADTASKQAEVPLKKAQANEANARAGEAAANAKKTKEETPDETLVDSIGSGKVTPERLSYLLARNPSLLSAVTAKYPDFDGSKAEAYPATYKDFTSGKTSVALNAGGTALKHLKELNDMNTVASHIYGTPAYTAYQNKVDTVAPELAKFYGDTTIPAIAALKSTLAANLPGGRQAAISTQAKSMGDKLDSYEQTWKNAAPSAGYEAPMPGISAQAKEARAALDPEYRQREVQTQTPLPKGSGQPLDPGTASTFLKAAAGDKAKARQLAQQNGWKF
jgi:hypothetical protein